MVHVEGYPWKVNYFQQLLNQSDSTAGQNLAKAGIYQQYHFIQELILKVSSPLSQSQNEETKSFQITGTANVYPPFIPNVGDMFVADIGDGRPAVFEVMKSERKSFFKEATYQIDYVSTGFAESERIQDLESKVVKRSVFSMDFLEHGQNPVIYQEDFATIKDLQTAYVQLTRKYLRQNYSTRFNAMAVPDTSEEIYEPFLTRAVAKWYTSDDYHKLTYLTQINLEEDPVFKSYSIFDLIETRDTSLFDEIFTKVSKVNAASFSREPRFSGLRYSPFNAVVYPVDYMETPDITLHQTRALKQIGASFPPSLPFEIKELDYIPVIPKVNLDQSYIFSPFFYMRDRENLTHLEAQVLNYIERKPVDANKVLFLANDYSSWGPLEKFYLTPFVIVLIKAAIRDFQ